MAKRKTAIEAEGERKSSATSAVVKVNGQAVRTYTLETHGENFAGLAKQMADQHERSIIELV